MIGGVGFDGRRHFQMGQILFVFAAGGAVAAPAPHFDAHKAENDGHGQAGENAANDRVHLVGIIVVCG